MKATKKLAKTQKAINKFCEQTKKNYELMKSRIKIIWLACMTLVLVCIATSCNVTRTITTQSQYYQKGDTTCTIVTKTIEQYEATKKL